MSHLASPDVGDRSSLLVLAHFRICLRILAVRDASPGSIVSRLGSVLLPSPLWLFVHNGTFKIIAKETVSQKNKDTIGSLIFECSAVVLPSTDCLLQQKIT